VHPDRLPFLHALDAFSVAEQLGRGLDFVEVYGDYQWGRGVSAGSEEGLRRMVLAAGLGEEGWGRVLQLLSSESPTEKFCRWEALTEANKGFLLERGLWGVPCLRYGDVVVFGQDKLWVIERLLQRDIKLLNEQRSCSSTDEKGSRCKNREEDKRDEDVLNAIFENCSFKL
jgi:2-hydroxychromene-2-carboxylate isomerase